MSDTTHPLTREEEIAKAGAGFGNHPSKPPIKLLGVHLWKWKAGDTYQWCEVCGARFYGLLNGYIPPCPGAPERGP